MNLYKVKINKENKEFFVYVACICLSDISSTLINNNCYFDDILSTELISGSLIVSHPEPE